MANLAASAVTITAVWYEGARVASRRKKVRATLVLTGQGGATNKIPAALFGLRYIDEVSDMRDTSNNLFLAAASYDHSTIIIGDVDGDGAPTDTTATVKVVVSGRE